MAGPSKSDYIRWVKGSLNRLLPGTSLADDGQALLEYRSWLITFQMKNKLAVNAKVDRPTQDALIKANRKHGGYVRWIQNALLISGEGVKVGGKDIAADGAWGPHTEQAVKAFQAKHEKVKADGWVGANTERLLMLRTATVPPGRTKVLREPKYDPVTPIWDVPVPDDPIPELTGVSYRFDTSEGVNLAATIYGVSAGTIYVEEMSKRTRMGLSYAALGLGLSRVPWGVDLFDNGHGLRRRRLSEPDPRQGNGDAERHNRLVPHLSGRVRRPRRGLRDHHVPEHGRGAGFGFAASMTGVGTLVAPVLMVKSCRAIVAIRGINHGTPNVGVSGAIGYLSFGDAKQKIDQLKELLPD